MAEAPVSEVSVPRRMERDFQEEFLTCSLCSEAYDHDQRVAKYLPCLHTFCRNCLVRYIRDNQEECLCPVCRKTTTIPQDGVDGIPNNFTVENLKEYQAIFRAEPGQKHGLQCTSCEEGLDAENFCHDCGYFLCSGCTDAHRKMRQLKGHTLSSITELQQKIRTPALLRKERCEQHKGQEISLYCMKCAVVVCNTCAIAGHERSEGHVLVDLDDEIERAKRELRKKASEVGKQEEPIVRVAGQIDSEINEMNSVCTQMEKEICESFLKLTSTLNERRDAAISDLRQLCQARAKSLREQKDRVESVVTQMESACEFAERACTSANPSQLLGARSQVLGRLEELSVIASNPLVPESIFCLAFHANHSKAMAEVDNAASSLGMIISVKKAPPSCQISIEEPIIVGKDCCASLTISEAQEDPSAIAKVLYVAIVSHKNPGGGKICRAWNDGNYTYSVNFVPDDLGPHDMIVKLRNEEVPGGCIKFDVKEHVRDIHEEEAGAGVDEGRPRVQAQVTWATAFPEVTHSVEVKYNPESNKAGSKDLLLARITNADGKDIPYRIHCRKGSKLMVKYTPMSAGDLKIALFINNCQVEGNPFIIHVQDLLPTACDITWDPHPVVNQIWRVNIATKDANGEALTSGGRKIVVKVVDQSTAKEIPCALVDNEDGTYTASLIPRRAARHMIKVVLDTVLLGKEVYGEQVDLSKAVGYPWLVEPACLAISTQRHEICMVDAKTFSIVSPDEKWEAIKPRRKLDAISIPSSKIAFDNKGRLLLMTPRSRRVYTKLRPTTDMWTIPDHLVQPETLSLTSTAKIIIGDSKSNALFVFSMSGVLMNTIMLSPGCMTQGVNNVCVDAKNNIFVCHGEENSIFKIDSDGNSERILQMVGK